MKTINPPTTEQELMQRTQQIAGMTMAELAEHCDVELAENLNTHKGWVGQLLEISLGASAGSKPEPDFVNLGVELKTLPLNLQNNPCETTFVSAISLLEIHKENWTTSLVRKKLANVLWVPIQGDRSIPLAERRIGNALLWQLDAELEEALQADWQELTDMICLGKLEYVTAQHGKYLQVRPKGANAKSLCWGFNAEGEKVQTLPRGFYLRTAFTKRILEKFYQ